jgi:YHS domain-containing protein
MNLRAVALLILPCSALLLSAIEPEPAPHENPAKVALEEFQDLIGGWRGVGMPVRGSTKGAWQETADWAWSFKDKQPAIVYSIEKGTVLTSARLTFDPEKKIYLLKATYADKSEREFSGTLDKKILQLVSKADAEGQTQRITITRLNEKRTLVLLERSIAADRYFRIAEVGYTREGTHLAVAGSDGPECVVTGGKGTIPVSYKGTTYYVCCTGCKQAFEDDPEGVIADYEAKVAARKAKANP